MNMKNCELTLKKSILNSRERERKVIPNVPSQNSQLFLNSTLREVIRQRKREREREERKKNPVESADSCKSHTAGRSQMTV